MALLHCKRGCRNDHSAACLALREVVYLGQVAALDHLNELALKAGLPVILDLTVYKAKQGNNGRKSAFPYYERALEAASAALEGGQFDLETLAGTLAPAQAQALELRLRMTSRQDVTLAVPGRREWLVLAS